MGLESVVLESPSLETAAEQLPSLPEEPVIAPRKIPSEAPPLLIPAADYSQIAGKGAPALAQIREEIGDCTRCKLSKTRNKIVFGDGDPNARLLFVGEGPGADEDAQGIPFVGRGGQLLNNMINAMGLKREQVYIANIVKCRPPQNRVPEPDEAHTCMPFLEQQIAAVQPEVIVALGATAATYLLGVKSSLGALRGKLHASRGAKLIVTYHPAFLLRDPRQKKEAWADLKMAMAELGLRPPAKPPTE
jgi:DNA polymerase